MALVTSQGQLVDRPREVWGLGVHSGELRAASRQGPGRPGSVGHGLASSGPHLTWHGRALPGSELLASLSCFQSLLPGEESRA